MSIIKDFFKKKPEKTSEKAQMDSKHLADQARQSGQKLADELDAIICKNTNGKISEEKVATYNQIIYSIAENIRHSKTLDVEITNVDDAILKIVEVLQNSIEAGYDRLAANICEKLKLVIGARCITFGSDNNQRENQLKNRNDMIQLMTNILISKFCIEQDEEKIANYNIQLEENNKEAQEVKKQLYDFLEKNPALKKTEDLTINQLATTTVEKMNNMKHHAVNLLNARMAIEQNINKITAEIVELKTKVNNDEIALKNQNKFKILLDSSAKIIKQQLADMNDTIKSLRAESDTIEAIMREDRTSQDAIDWHIKTTNEFNKMIEEEQQREEQKRQYEAEKNAENKMLN